ncbi:MAG: shikimate dehydrogenase [Clostridiales bacterium]|nr:shikimate dehydrogenase [Clostridiales bacterium]
MKVNFSSKTKLYAVIGDPIAHSLSPVFQNNIIELKNMDAVYIPLQITVASLGYDIELLRNNFSGFNVTLPHKESIMKYLDEIDPIAKEYGAVNTVKVMGGKLIGYNTDGYGFRRSIEDIGVDLKNKRILLLGAGGAAKVIAFEIIKLGGKLTITNRNLDRAHRIKADLEGFYDVPIKVVQLDKVNKFYDIVINTTPVGMYPEINNLPINPDRLPNAELVYDIIYNPPETELLKTASSYDVKTINGLPMLIYQGLKSFELWTGKAATTREMYEIYGMLERSI